MKIAPLAAETVSFIAHHMREWDRREIFATRWSDDHEDLVNDCLLSGSFSWVMGLERPICAIGARPCWPGVWSMWMFATDEWKKISTSVTKFGARVMLPKLIASGAGRLECRVLDGHPSGNWIRWFCKGRAVSVVPLPSFGKAGEDFSLYALDLRR